MVTAEQKAEDDTFCSSICFIFLKLLESDVLKVISLQAQWSSSKQQFCSLFYAGWPGRPAQRDSGDGETAAPGAPAAGHQEESAGVSLRHFIKQGGSDQQAD